MRLLLDTHILLWALNDDRRLGAPHREALAVAEALFVSAATIWEIAVKRAAGKLNIDGDAAQAARQAGCWALPITWRHAEEAGALPRYHADPFDRLLIAQARLENLLFVSADRMVRSYDVALL